MRITAEYIEACRAKYEDRVDPKRIPPRGKVLQWVTDGQHRTFAVYRDYDPEDGKWP